MVGHFDGDPPPSHNGSFSAQYGVQTLNRHVWPDGAGLGVPEWRFDCGSGSVGTRHGANPPEVDVQMTEAVSNLMEHNQVTVTGQSD